MTDATMDDNEEHGLRMGERKMRGSIHNRSPQPWHVDRKVPIIGIIIIIAQFLSFVGYSAVQSYKIDQHDKRLDHHDALLENSNAGVNALNERMARMETSTQIQMTTLERIEGYLRRK